MEVKKEAGSGDDNHLSFFTDFNKKFKGMKEMLAEKVSSALEDEFESTFEEVKSACSEVLDSSVCTIDSGDDVDDVPLMSRLKNEKVDDHVSTRRTRSSRRGAKKKTEPVAKVLPVAASDVVILSDLDDDVLCVESNYGNTHVLSSSNADLNVSVDLTLDDIEEDENTLVSIKINWMDLKTHRFELHKHQTFSFVFEELAKKENVPVDKILLILRDRIFISKEDSAESLNISIVDVIEGGITKEAYKNVSERKETGKNILEFKCVLKDQKKPLLVAIRKMDSMHCLMVKTSELLGRPLEALKFKFEGEELEGEATPEDLDLEGGEVIEVFIKS